jgi:hypothetical protein
MKTHIQAPVSTLALAYKNGSRFVSDNQTYAERPANADRIWLIQPDGSLLPEVAPASLAFRSLLDS